MGFNDLESAIELYKDAIEVWVGKDDTIAAKLLNELTMFLTRREPKAETPLKKAARAVIARSSLTRTNSPLSKVVKRNRRKQIPCWRTIRKDILRRDEECCRICANDYYLHVHHIDCDRTNNDWSNLVTLCESCHQTVHSEGYKPSDYPDYPAPWDEKEPDDGVPDEYNEYNQEQGW